MPLLDNDLILTLLSTGYFAGESIQELLSKILNDILSCLVTPMGILPLVYAQKNNAIFVMCHHLIVKIHI